MGEEGEGSFSLRPEEDDSSQVAEQARLIEGAVARGLEGILLCDELTATFDPTMRFKRSNSNLENFHDVFGVAAFSLLLALERH